MDAPKPGPIRGRGALIAAALKKAQEATATQEVPRPRGRAALLEQLKRKSVSHVGETSQTSSENSSVDELTKEVSQLEVELPCLEYKGVSGTVVPASANYISLKLEPERGAFQYEVRFDPVVDSKSARVKILYKILDFCPAKTFDGRSLFLPNKIIENRKIYTCDHPFNDETINVTIIFVKEKRMGECLQLYNVLFNKIMYILKYKRVRRQFFDNSKPFLVPQHKLEIWPGYVVSVNEYSGGVMLCLDTQHRVLRTQNALELIENIVMENVSHYKQFVERALLNSIVLTRYNNKTYPIHDIAWDMNPMSQFETSDGSKISFVEYYKRQYNLDIRDRGQPLLINRQTVPSQNGGEREDRIIMLVPELSFLTGLTDEMRSDFRVMKDIAQYTRITPNQRMNALRKFTNNVHSTKEATDVLSAWGLRLDKATIDLQMRILEPEDILFGNDVRVHGTIQADWTSAAMKNPVIVSIDFQKWILVHTYQDKRQADEFIQCLQRHGPKMGININKPRMVCMPDDKTESYIKVLNENFVPGLQIVCIITPTNREDRYMAIKKLCCAQVGVPSQVINSKTLRNPKRLTSITQKIALQINCKLGGGLWSVRFPFKKWMICGIDIHHSGASMSAKSAAGFVSSLNDTMSKWYSRCFFHADNKEISDHLKMMLYSALMEFQTCNSFFPSHVIIYRDGVGDSQIDMCKNFEVKQLSGVMKEMGLKTKLVYIVVQKRINTRIIMTTQSEDNPPAGSIVDDTITQKYLYDFFLVSQHVRQGTVSPTHYIVVHDDADIKPDYVQRLTYKMCHMYYNWTGTIRVPAPCQYAHKLAYLIGQNVREEHSRHLSHKLFYL